MRDRQIAVVTSAGTSEAPARAAVRQVEYSVREYRTIDKSGWGPGPWQAEIDKRQWIDAETGFPCLIVRSATLGSLCGYVGVSRDHPAHGMHFYHGPHEDGTAPLTPVEAAINDIGIHGGLTFAGGCGHGDDESRDICHVPEPGDPDDIWWFGFDCAHIADFWPASARHHADRWTSLGAPLGFGRRIEYRDVGYVTRQCTALAEQLRAIARSVLAAA